MISLGQGEYSNCVQTEKSETITNSHEEIDATTSQQASTYNKLQTSEGLYELDFHFQNGDAHPF